MLLTAYNLPNYILQKGTESGFCVLGNIFSGNTPFLIENIDLGNPRNTLLKYTAGDKSFVFKQPKFLTNGGTWLIANEYQFYKAFPELPVKPQLFSFDEHYKILLLPYLQSLPPLDEVIRCSSKLQLYAQQAAESLALLHQSLALETEPLAGSFAKENCFNAVPNYSSFLSLLQRGFNHPQFLDEVVFPAFINIAPSRAILHHFLSNVGISESLENLTDHTIEQHLIHGDLKIENLLKEKSENTLKFIDFENVSKGDHAWDFACFLESVFYQPALRRSHTPEKHRETLMKRFFFFAVYLNTYCELFGFDEYAHRQFLKRVMLFWSLRKLEKLRNYDGNFNFFLISLEVTKKLLLQTDYFIDQIYSADERRFEIFEF